MKFPRAIQDLIDNFSELPTVGPKTAQRYVFYLLKQPQAELEKIAGNIRDLKNNLKVCKNCLAISESDPCPICLDKKRNHSLLCLISTQAEMLSIEKTGKYDGLYLVLGKNIWTRDGMEKIAEQISVKKLLEKAKSGKIKEIILALSPTIEGETAGMYLIKILRPHKLKITRLARGLPMGSDIEYADEITLNNALKNRNEVIGY